MKNYLNLLILLLILSASEVHAGAVEKCVGSNGKVTYTDKGCKGKETSQDAYLLGTSTNNRNKNQEKSTVRSFRVSEIGALTEQAVAQCGKKASKYFAGSHPEVTEESEAEFQTIVDRSLHSDKVEIVLAGVIRVQDEKDTQEMNIQCNASRSRETDWVLVFKDTSADSKSNTAAAKQ
jgi:hypothetical protein